MKAFLQLPHWWKNGLASSLASVPYQVVCACGQSCQGVRQARFQVVRCQGCNRELFILPLSPLPAVGAPDAADGAVKPALPGRPPSPWFWPLIAGGLTFVVSVAILALCLDRLFSGPRPILLPPPSAGEIEQRLDVGRKSLLIGDFQQAHSELNGIQAVLQAHPLEFTASQRQQLRQLHRQATLLADWPREPLEQVLVRAAPLNADEWRTVVGGYRGKAFLFNVELRRDASRQYQVKCVHPNKVPLRLDVQTLKLLSFLPLEEPQQVLFAARLAEIRREGAENCVVRLEPDSGVLLTDTTSAALGGVVAENDLQTILRRQQQWSAELP